MQRIGIGRLPAKPAADLAIGDVLVWNYGYRYEVVGIERRGASSLSVTEKCAKTGTEYKRNLRMTTLVATAN